MRAIRHSTLEDLPCLMELFRQARDFMVSTGNPHQWGDGYPSADMVESDILRGVSYIVEEEGMPIATFALIPGADPTYAVIEDGAWIDDALPYATLHRLASSTESHGVAETVFTWCKQQHDVVRADTYHDNHVLQHILRKEGFRYCGIIYVRNHSPRLAYQWIRNT
jgi:hypothetical protein